MKKGYKRGVLITKNKENGNAEAIIIEYENKLSSICKQIEANFLEMPTRYISGKPYTIICDEEGLLDKNKRFLVNAISRDMEEMLVGTLLIVGTPNEKGEIRSLTMKECEHIAKTDSLYWRMSTKQKTIRVALIYDWRPTK